MHIFIGVKAPVACGTLRANSFVTFLPGPDEIGFQACMQGNVSYGMCEFGFHETIIKKSFEIVNEMFIVCLIKILFQMSFSHDAKHP
jgi:hypothetical protein